MKGQTSQLQHEAEDDRALVKGWILHERHARGGLWLQSIVLRRCHALLQLSHAGEVLIELLTIRTPERALHGTSLRTHAIKDAASFLNALHLCFHFRGTAIDKKLRKGLRRAAFRWHGHATAGVAEAGTCARRHREERKSSLGTDAFSQELIHGDAVAKAWRAGMRRTSEEGFVRVVPVPHVGMIQAGDDREVAAMRLDDLQIGRGRVVAARLLRKKMRRMIAEVVPNAEKAPRRHRVSRKCCLHRLQPRQRKRNAALPKQRAP